MLLSKKTTDDKCQAHIVPQSVIQFSVLIPMHMQAHKWVLVVPGYANGYFWITKQSNIQTYMQATIVVHKLV